MGSTLNHKVSETGGKQSAKLKQKQNEIEDCNLQSTCYGISGNMRHFNNKQDSELDILQRANRIGSNTYRQRKRGGKGGADLGQHQKALSKQAPKYQFLWKQE